MALRLGLPWRLLTRCCVSGRIYVSDLWQHTETKHSVTRVLDEVATEVGAQSIQVGASSESYRLLLLLITERARLTCRTRMQKVLCVKEHTGAGCSRNSSALKRNSLHTSASLVVGLIWRHI